MSSLETFELAADSTAARTAAESLFASVSAELAAMLPASADIRHIGATAIPGCRTKGDLDIVVRIDERDFPAADRMLEKHFARNLGSVRTASFSAFEDAGTTPHLGVQLVAVGSAHDDFHRFVAALRSDPDLAEAYNRLKEAWQGKPMDDYRAAKDSFITGVLDGREP